MYLGYYLQFYLLYVQAKLWSYPSLTRLTIVIFVSLILVLIINQLRNLFYEAKYSQDDQSFRSFKERLESAINDILMNRNNLSEQNVLNDFESIYNIKGSRRGLKFLSKLLIQANLNSKIGKVALNDNNYNIIMNTYGLVNFWELELVSNNLNRIFKAKKNLDNLKNDYQQQILHISAHNLPKKLNNKGPQKLMKTENNEPYKFLDESFVIEFNPLDEILVHQFLMVKAEAGRLPLLSRWVRNSTNTAFRIFMIREIAFFNQSGCGAILASLLCKETCNEIRLAIIETLTSLNHKQSESHIIACYPSSNKKVKRAIIRAVTTFKTKFGLEFLNEVFFDSTDNILKEELIQAMKTIRNQYDMENEGKEDTEPFYEKTNNKQINYQIG